MMKKFISKKYIFLLAAVMCVCAIGFFWQEVLGYSLNLYLKKISYDKFAGTFTADRIYKQNEYWIIENPQIIGHRDLNDGGIHMMADKVELSVSPHFFARQIDLAVNIIKPHLNIKQTSADAQTVINELFPSTSYYKVNAKVSVSEGALHFHDFKQDPPTRQTLYFEIEGEHNEGHQGQILVSLDDPNLECNCIMLSLNKSEKRLVTLDFNFEDVQSSALINAASNFLPPLSYLNVDEGTVSGQMVLSIPEEGKAFAKGDLALHNVRFNSPELELQGYIQAAVLHLTENSEAELSAAAENTAIPATKGYLEIGKEASLEFKKGGNPYCKVTELLGGVYFEKSDSAFVKLDGICSHHNTISKLHLDGSARFDKGQQGIALDFAAQFSSPENNYAKTRFTTRTLDSKLTYADIHLEHFGPSDFDLLKMFFVPYFPEMHEIRMDKGFIDVSALAYLDGLQMTDVKIEKIAAKGVHFNLAPWNLVLKAGNLIGNLSVNLKAQKSLDTLNADLDISDSHLCIFGDDANACQLSDMQTKLVVRKGVIEASSVKGVFAGLKGTLLLDGTSNTRSEIAQFNFKGDANEIIEWMKDPLREKLKNQFSQDIFTLSGSIQKAANGLKIEGALNIKGPKEKFGQTFEYGFDVEKASRAIEDKNSSLPLPESIIQEFSTADADKTTSPVDHKYSFLVWLKNALLMNSLVIKDGWCQGQNVSLQKYIDPFLFSRNQAHLTGAGDFQATFNQHFAVVNFDLRQAAISNDDLHIDIKNLSADLEKDPSVPLPAAYYIDFNKEVLYGLIPIANGTYHEKNSGLLFTDIHCLALLKDKHIHLTHLNTACIGMRFDGKLEVDLSSPLNNVFSVNIISHKIQGQFSQLQQIFAHFDSLAFMQKIPLEGHLELDEKGATLLLDFIPGDFNIASTASGKLSKGQVTWQNKNIDIHEIETHFDFDHSAKTLNFTDIQGKVSLGGEEAFHEYLFAGDQVRFTNLHKKEATFDLWLSDSHRDILRVAGKTQVRAKNEDLKVLEFVLDSDLTHLGNIKPKDFSLQLKENNELYEFNLELALKVESLLYDMLLANHIGLLHLPSKFLSDLLKNNTGAGDAALRFHFDDKSAMWTGHLDAADIHIGTHHFDKFSLHGKKNGDIWAIDQLLLDHISVAADLVRHPDGWKANFLGIRFGESLLLGMEGNLDEKALAFEGRVNLLELNLDKLKEWPKLRQFAIENDLKGFFKGTGTIRAESKIDTPSGWQLDVALNSAVKNLHLRGMNFEDAGNISCHYVSDHSLTFSQFKSHFKDPASKIHLGAINLDKITYDFSKDELAVNTLRFSIPPECISHSVDHLQYAFEKAISPQTAEIINNLKSDSPLEGHVDLVYSPTASQLQVYLKDDTYRFLGQDHETHALVLKYNLHNLKLSTQYRIHGYPFWLTMQANAPEFNSGVITLSDHSPEASSDSHPSLAIHWRNNEQDGFLVDRAHGVFCGLSCHLAQDKEILSSSETLNLFGSVSFDPARAAKLVGNDLSVQLEALGLGSGYVLQGRWSLDKHPIAMPGLPFRFQGYLQGQNISIKGYEFQNLEAQVDIHSQNIYVRQFKIEDPSMQLAMEQAHFFQAKDDEWVGKIPGIQINEFRPSLLHEPEASPPKQPGSLVIRTLDIENLQGHMANPQTWTGKGKLQFINPPKKNLANTIFAIPGEILTMLGLNLSVLNPVSGTVFYEIKDSKFYLTKFKDVYSEGKLSKFNLSDSKEPSYVKFDGQLNLRIRMKQYNLFFKLAELFTVNVGGNLSKPTYSLHKHTSKDTASK